MKKGKFIVSALISAALMVSSVFGSEGEKYAPSRSAEYSVRVQLAQLMSREEVEGNKGEVSVVFSSFPSNPFKVLSVTGSSKELVNKFKSRLEKTPLKVPDAMFGHSYSVTIHFSDIEELPVVVERGHILSREVFSILSTSQVSESGKIKVKLMVKNDKVTILAIEGDNSKLTSNVEYILKNSVIDVRSEIPGIYSIPVKF